MLCEAWSNHCGEDTDSYWILEGVLRAKGDLRWKTAEGTKVQQYHSVGGGTPPPAGAAEGAAGLGRHVDKEDKKERHGDGDGLSE